MTAQEIGQFARLGLRPVIFVANNDGYLIEPLLCKDPETAYNDVAPWHYTELPPAFGCYQWITVRAATCAEFKAPLEIASSSDYGVYIEIVTDRCAASELATRLHDSLSPLYRKN